MGTISSSSKLIKPKNLDGWNLQYINEKIEIIKKNLMVILELKLKQKLYWRGSTIDLNDKEKNGKLLDCRD